MAKQIYIDENGNEQLVSGTINTADMLPIESGSATNTKDYIDTGLSDKVDTSDIPTAYTTSGLTGGYGITIESGGYAKLGNIVIVNVRLSISSSATGNLVAGFPLPNVVNNSVSLTNNKLQDIVLGTNGIASTTATITGTLILSGVYISQ